MTPLFVIFAGLLTAVDFFLKSREIKRVWALPEYVAVGGLWLSLTHSQPLSGLSPACKVISKTSSPKPPAAQAL